MSARNLQEAVQALRRGEAASALPDLKLLVKSQSVSAEEYAVVARLINQYRPPVDARCKIQVLGQCTTNWLADSLLVHAWCSGLDCSVTSGVAGVVVQTLLSLTPGPNDVVVLVPWLASIPAGRTQDEVVSEQVEFWKSAWSILRKKGISFMQLGYDYAGPGADGYFLAARGMGIIPFVRRINALLREGLTSAEVFVDVETVSGMMGRRTFYDARRYLWTQQPFSDKGCVLLAQHIARAVEVTRCGAKKVLVLDLDDTLWGGVVAEVGANSIEIGGTPAGEGYKEFQRYCKQLAARGILLAVASKNNESDAKAAFLENRQMLLKQDDFVSFKAGWYPKSEMIRHISRELALGLDAFVFFDDNPVERQEVKDALPQVEVVDVPDDPALFVQTVEDLMFFEVHNVTQEDLKRKAQYASMGLRASTSAECADLATFLTSLHMVAEVSPIDESKIIRCHQLIGKTNQFNVSVRRHSEAQLRMLLATPDSIAFCLSLSDRFGDYGIIGVLIAIPRGDRELFIDTMLISCRAIGRTVEQFMISHLVDKAREKGLDKIAVDYVMTSKNSLLGEIIPALGLELQNKQDGKASYSMDVNAFKSPTTYIRR